MFKTSIITFITCSYLVAAPQMVRWTAKEDRNPDLLHVLELIRSKSGINLSVSDFMPLEDRQLATSHFTMLAQVAAGVPIRSQSIRIWTSLTTGETIQVEAYVDSTPKAEKWALDNSLENLSSQQTTELVRKKIQNHPDDPKFISIKWTDFLDKGILIREVTAKGKRGKHKISINVSSHKIVKALYEEFPQADMPNIPVKIYPVYEEKEDLTGELLPRVEAQLRYLKQQVHRIDADPYGPLRLQRYVDDKYDPLLGLTSEGRKQGFWAMSYIKNQARSLVNALPFSANTFEAGGVLLDGRFATVSIYPDALTAFKNWNFKPTLSPELLPFFKDMADKPGHSEMIPLSALRGRPISSIDDAYNRPARRLPDHDPVSYINDGFDEIQVYWSITQMFESLRSMGFLDPELSTRPFNAFLFNPDISYRDNAFYTDDTINFTTYSPKAANYARDNSTIWHELGHGVMDRLMGDYSQLADTGGLSEGMADFIAQLILNDVTSITPYPGKESLRIFNNTGFNLTNEVHDDGEAYGGSMNDLLRTATSALGRDGLVKVTDLTLEAMRLSRNHPALTAQDWFNRMLFADELGSSKRKPLELHSFITNALNGRNFTFGNSVLSTFTIKNGEEEVTSTSLGSRGRPIPLKLLEAEKASFTLNVDLKSSPNYAFKFPVTIKVELRKGPLQGAVHWEGEENTPLQFTLNSEADSVKIPLTAYGKCDEVNRPDGSCVDFAYVQVWNSGETNKPQAKKRFYLRVFPQLK